MDPRPKERLPQLDLFRAFAVFSVIMVHANSVTMAEQTLSPSLFYFYNAINILFKFGVTSFIFLSGFVLFYNYFDKPFNLNVLANFYKKRLVSIGLPYLLVSGCYYGLVAWQNGRLLTEPAGTQLRLFGKELIHGTAYTHLYFIFIMIQFYLLFPLVLWLLQKLRNRTLWLMMTVPIGFGLQWGFYFWNKYRLHLPNKGSFAPTYISYFLVGAVMAVFYDRIRGWLNTGWRGLSGKGRLGMAVLWMSWIAVTLYHIQLWYELRRGINSASTLTFEIVWVVEMVLSILVLLHAVFQIYLRSRSFWVKTLTRLGGLSFGIYLFHPVVLREYRLFVCSRYTLDPNTWIYFLYIAGGSIAALFGSWIFVQFCFKRLPFASWFLGSVPASLKKKALKTDMNIPIA